MFMLAGNFIFFITATPDEIHFILFFINLLNTKYE